jgi:hypothetical protein
MIKQPPGDVLDGRVSAFAPNLDPLPDEVDRLVLLDAICGSILEGELLLL